MGEHQLRNKLGRYNGRVVSKKKTPNGECILLHDGDRYHMHSPVTGVHSISADPEITPRARLKAHWHGFLMTNGVQPLEPHQHTRVFTYRGWREGHVLAVDTELDVALVEYEMLNGHTALAYMSRFGEHSFYDGPQKNPSYKSLPVKWLRRIVEAGSKWKGRPLRGGPVRDPEVELSQRGR